MKKQLLLITLIASMISLTSAAIVFNSSEAVNLNISNSEEYSFNQTGLNLQGNRIDNFFAQGECQSNEAIKTIYPNGSYSCNKLSTTTQAENLSETLAAGNVANQSIDMDGNDIDNVRELNSDGNQIDVGAKANFTSGLLSRGDIILHDDISDNPKSILGVDEIVLSRAGSQTIKPEAFTGPRHLKLTGTKVLGGGGTDVRITGGIESNSGAGNGSVIIGHEHTENIGLGTTSPDAFVDIEGGKLDLSSNNITGIDNLENFFDQNECADDEAIKTIYPNGSYACNSISTTTQAENLSETLAAGNVANQTINMQDETLSFNNYNIYSGTGIQIGDSSTSTGDGNAMAIGNNASASNIDAASLGVGSSASGPSDIAIGNDADASGDEGFATPGGKAIAIGRLSSASDAYTVALGRGASASANTAVAIGRNSDSSDDSGVAIGQRSSASTSDAVTIGSYAGQNSNEGSNAVLIGPDPGGINSPGSVATGDDSIGLGTNVSASANGAVAIGDNAKAPNSYEATFGKLNGEELDVNITGNATVHGSGGLETDLVHTSSVVSSNYYAPKRLKDFEDPPLSGINEEGIVLNSSIVNNRTKVMEVRQKQLQIYDNGGAGDVVYGGAILKDYPKLGVGDKVEFDVNFAKEIGGFSSNAIMKFGSVSIYLRPKYDDFDIRTTLDSEDTITRNVSEGEWYNVKLEFHENGTAEVDAYNESEMIGSALIPYNRSQLQNSEMSLGLENYGGAYDIDSFVYYDNFTLEKPAKIGSFNNESNLRVSGNQSIGGDLSVDGRVNEQNVRDISYSTGHTVWSSGLSSEEVNRFGTTSGEKVEVDRLDVQVKGGGTNSNFEVEAYDAGSSTVLGSTTAGTPINDVGTTSEGGDLTIRVTNNDGSDVTASITLTGHVVE